MYPNVTYICLSRNFGQHNALLTGIRYAKGEYVVCLDDDMETPPKESLKLLHAIRQTHQDVVYGQYQRNASWFRSLGSWMNNAMVDFVFHKPHEVVLNSYFVMNSFIAKQIGLYDGPFVYIPGLVFRVTRSVSGVPIVVGKRMYGSSNYSLKTLFLLWANGIANYSLFPLRASIAVGLFVAFLGFVISLFIVISRLSRPDVAVGWASIIATILVFGGLTLLFIGFVGEYVGRIFFTLTKNPQAVIRTIIRKGTS
jgi:glycosyltransferase involved in cell wall biosynthesis